MNGSDLALLFGKLIGLRLCQPSKEKEQEEGEEN